MWRAASDDRISASQSHSTIILLFTGVNGDALFVLRLPRLHVHTEFILQDILISAVWWTTTAIIWCISAQQRHPILWVNLQPHSPFRCPWAQSRISRIFSFTSSILLPVFRTSRWAYGCPRPKANVERLQGAGSLACARVLPSRADHLPFRHPGKIRRSPTRSLWRVNGAVCPRRRTKEVRTRARENETRQRVVGEGARRLCSAGRILEAPLACLRLSRVWEAGVLGNVDGHT